jgi:hypothetical protein
MNQSSNYVGAAERALHGVSVTARDFSFVGWHD